MVSEFPDVDQRLAVCTVQNTYGEKVSRQREAAIIVDIDGTIFQARKPVRKVIDFVNKFQGKVIIVTARDEAQRQTTVKQLKAARVKYNELLMRTEDIPQETYKATIAADLISEYAVNLVIENDPSSRRKYEELGLDVLDPRQLTQNTYGEKISRICFQRRPRKKVGRYEVNEKTGTMSDVSLIQIGEAKGHGVWIDAQSLESGLEAVGGSLPAYVTHEGAVDSDRLLKEVGLFSGFYIEDGKLKAESFKALESFRVDEAERFRRLFDLAREMPDAFGLSLVFEARLVWIMEGGEEISVEDSDGEGAIRSIPSVRFISIRSADFVDAPAANKEGLFNSHTKIETIMAKENLIELSPEEEILLDEATEAEVTENAEATNAEPEQLDEEQQTEIDRLREEMGRHDDRLNMLEDGIADLKERLTSANTENEELSTENEQLSKKTKALSAVLEDGADPLEESSTADSPSTSIVDEFNAARGADQNQLWKQNKIQILNSIRRN
jgi:hypothetical protein